MVNTLTARKGRKKDGITISPGKTFEELRQEDPNPGADEIYKPRPAPGDSYTIPNSWFFSEEHAALEEEKLWSKVWVWACREEQLPNVGSCYVYDFLDYSVLITRVSKTEIKAYRNTCMHRGNQLRPSGSCGVINKFFCPYHGATWNLDGSLKSWPFPYEFPGVSNETHRLEEVHIGIFQGFIFVNMASDPIPFEEYIDPLPKMMDGVNWNNRYPIIHMRKKLRCNWKIVVQAFNETMHVPVTHAQARPMNLVAGSQPDELGKYVFRIISPNFVAGDTMPHVVSEDAILKSLLSQINGMDDLKVPEGMRARDFMAMMVVSMVESATGVDLRDKPTTLLVDNHPIHIFPNFLILNSYFGPTAMLMSPGATPDESYFDIIWFQECVEGFEKPAMPERIDVSEDETFQDRGEGSMLFPTLIPDQDTANMEGQQRGLKASPDGVSIFSNYLESGIIHDLKLHKEFFEM